VVFKSKGSFYSATRTFELRSPRDFVREVLLDFRFYLSISCVSGTISYNKELRELYDKIIWIKTSEDIASEKIRENYPSIFNSFYERNWPKVEHDKLVIQDGYAFGKEHIRYKVASLNPGQYDRQWVLSNAEGREPRINPLTIPVELRKAGGKEHPLPHVALRNTLPTVQEVTVLQHPALVARKGYHKFNLSTPHSTPEDDPSPIEFQQAIDQMRIFLFMHFCTTDPNPSRTAEITRIIELTQPDLIIMEKPIPEVEEFIERILKNGKRGIPGPVIGGHINGGEMIAANFAVTKVPGCRIIPLDIIDKSELEPDNKSSLSPLNVQPERPSYVLGRKREKCIAYQVQKAIEEHTIGKLKAARKAGVQPEPLVALFVSYLEDIQGIVKNWGKHIDYKTISDFMMTDSHEKREQEKQEAERRLRLGENAIIILKIVNLLSNGCLVTLLIIPHLLNMRFYRLGFYFVFGVVLLVKSTYEVIRAIYSKIFPDKSAESIETL